MKKSEIKVGGLYTARVSGQYTTVRVDCIRTVFQMGSGDREVTAYDVTDLATGRTTTFRSAAKFRSVAPATPSGGSGLSREAEAARINADTAKLATQTVSYNEDTEEDEQRSDPTLTVMPPTTPALTAVVSGVPATATSSLAARIAAANTPTSDGIKLTAEQEAGIKAALEVEARRSGPRVLVLKAGAGCGKTFELQQFEKVLSGNGQYTAFNRPLVDDSRPKFKRANCATTHSLAFKVTGRQFAHRLNGGRVRSYQVANILGISDMHVELPESIAPADVDTDTGEKKPQLRRLKAAYLAGQVTEAVKRFCQSADPAISERHFKVIPGIDEKGSYTNSDRVKQYLLPYARKAWDDLTSTDGQLPFAHDVYVKLWELGCGDDRPYIAAQYIMLDEYQDTAPVMVSILKQQTHALVILVGDDCQRIYEWRNAINAADEFPEAEVRYLSKSFRFGQTVADVANSVLAGLEVPTELVMKGLETIPSRVCKVEQPRCYIYRTNAGCIGRIMAGREEGKRGHLIGDVKALISFCKAAIELQAGQGTNHPELGCFSTWAEVQDYSKEDEGADLRLMVKLIDSYTAQSIVDALQRMPSEKDADFVTTTAHKSKGREWPSVKLGADFPLANKLTDADRRLVYVAATRAQEELDLTECPTFAGGWDKEGCEDGGGAKWVPGIEVTYTAPMPSEADLAAYRTARAARKSPTPADPATVAASPTPAAIAAPAPAPAPANSRPAEFSWANMDGGWMVRGPLGWEGKRVVVTKRNGQTSTETLRQLARTIGELGFYEVR